MAEIRETHSARVQLVEVDAERAGQRLDNFLITYLKNVPKSAIYRLIRRGEIRVNKKRAKPETRLSAGDQVRLPPIAQAAQPASATIPLALQRRLAQAVLYEDKAILVINKPAGLAVHGGSGLKFGVIEVLRSLYPAVDLELVHRLDRETSGCLVVAKKRSALRRLHELFRHAEVTKVYWALVKGRWRGGRRTARQALRKNLLQSGERMVRVDDEGKASETVFEPLRVWGVASLVQATPLTGRTHQIRVHATALGHPLAGDDKYGDEGFNRQMGELGLKRLFLHAAKITFADAEGKPITVEAPLDPALDVCLAKLGPSDAG